MTKIAIKNSFNLVLMLLFTDTMQRGVIRVVRTINKIDIPSMPTLQFIKPLIQVSSSKNWNSAVDGSNKYQRYKDKIKLANETKRAKYLMVRQVFDFDFEKKINKAPINGNKISDDKIGKSII